MSYLRAPGLGPIVGHTTHESSRIWIRAGDPGDSSSALDSERRTIGVIGILKSNGQIDPKQIHYFRLHREFDRTGSFELGRQQSLFKTTKTTKLKPKSVYRVRVGTLTLDDPMRDDEMLDNDDLTMTLPQPSHWATELARLPEKKSEAEFRTFAAPSNNDPADEVSFLSGSCRFPGLLFKAKRADKIFKAVLKEAETKRNGTEPSFVLMTGDQIYADTLNRLVPIGRADSFEAFQERYHTAFGSKNMRKLLRNKPVYMILDDHEIEDNWTQDRLSYPDKVFQVNKSQLFTIAIDAYMSYQWSHGPRNFGRRLFYTFECGGYPFFVCDTRTQRYMDDDENSLDDNHLIGRPSLGDSAPAQIDRLLAWLKSHPRKLPKFIVTSSVFAPSPIFARDGSSQKRKEKSDSWPAFPTTRRAILDCIVKNKIQNVIFLSGDIHCANVAELSFSHSGKNLKAYSITSSAFYWPFPFADGDPSNFVHDSRKPEQADPFLLGDGKTVMHYKAWNFSQEDNFCRVDIDRANAQVVVRTFDDEGEIIRHEVTGAKLEANLPLAPW
ncbi:MAG: alkaline phosphatase D family protein [Pseudomonadota bacterium]